MEQIMLLEKNQDNSMNIILRLYPAILKKIILNFILYNIQVIIKCIILINCQQYILNMNYLQ